MTIRSPEGPCARPWGGPGLALLVVVVMLNVAAVALLVEARQERRAHARAVIADIEVIQMYARSRREAMDAVTGRPGYPALVEQMKTAEGVAAATR